MFTIVDFSLCCIIHIFGAHLQTVCLVAVVLTDGGFNHLGAGSLSIDSSSTKDGESASLAAPVSMSPEQAFTLSYGSGPWRCMHLSAKLPCSPWPWRLAACPESLRTGPASRVRPSRCTDHMASPSSRACPAIPPVRHRGEGASIRRETSRVPTTLLATVPRISAEFSNLWLECHFLYPSADRHVSDLCIPLFAVNPGPGSFNASASVCRRTAPLGEQTSSRTPSHPFAKLQRSEDAKQDGQRRCRGGRASAAR